LIRCIDPGNLAVMGAKEVEVVVELTKIAQVFTCFHLDLVLDRLVSGMVDLPTFVASPSRTDNGGIEFPRNFQAR
jgi:hypothetical protein